MPNGNNALDIARKRYKSGKLTDSSREGQEILARGKRNIKKLGQDAGIKATQEELRGATKDKPLVSVGAKRGITKPTPIKSKVNQSIGDIFSSYEQRHRDNQIKGGIDPDADIRGSKDRITGKAGEIGKIGTRFTPVNQDKIKPGETVSDTVTEGNTGAGTTGISGSTGTDVKTFDSNADGVITGDELTGDYKTFFDGLSDLEKREFLAIGENAQENNLNIAESYANYIRDFETNKKRREEDEEYRLREQGRSEEIAAIQESQSLKKSKDAVDKLKRNIGYLGDRGMPGKSAVRAEALGEQIGNAEGNLFDFQKIQEISKQSRKDYYAQQKQNFERGIEDITTKLNDNVDKTIQDAFNSVTSNDATGNLETTEELKAFRDKMYQDLDASITGFTNASIDQMRFLSREVNASIKDAQAYESKKNEVNEELSKAKGYYINGNGDPIMDASGNRINIPEEAPIDPIFKDGKLVTFSTDENGQIKASVSQVLDEEVLSDKSASNYAQLVLDEKIKPTDVPSEFRDNETYINALSTGKPTDTNLQTQDFTTRSDLINKYPNEASFKNNNPAGITFGISPRTEGLLVNAGINYTLGTPRPSNEGGNYIKFPTVADGIKAQKILLSQAGSNDVNSRLQQWVGTKEGPTYAKNLMLAAGIPEGAKFSELSNEQLDNLVSAQIRKESPGFSKEIAKTGAGDDYDAQVLALTAGLGGTGDERKALQDAIVDRARNKGISLNDSKKELGIKTSNDVLFEKRVKEDYSSARKKLRESTSQARTTLTLLNQPQTAIGDVASVVGFLKTIDPTSVARESEVESVENARGVLQGLANTFTKLSTGQKLVPEQREQLRNAITTIVNAADAKHLEYVQELQSEFYERGLDSSVYISKNDRDSAQGLKEIEPTESDPLGLGLGGDTESDPLGIF